jgi:hypothetical protein
MATVFILEDDANWRIKLKTLFSDYDVVTAHDVKSALDALSEFEQNNEYPELYIFDYWLRIPPERKPDDKTGLDVAEYMLNKRKVASLLLSVDRNEEKVIKRAKDIGIPAKYRLDKEILTSDEGKNDFLEIVEDCIWDFNMNSPEAVERFSYERTTIGVRNGNLDDYFFTDYESILYLEANGNACKLFFKDRNPYIFGTGIGVIGPQISKRFLTFAPAGRKYYVNLNNITRLSNNSVYFSHHNDPNIVFISLSANAYSNLKQKLSIYIVKTGRGN